MVPTLRLVVEAGQQEGAVFLLTGQDGLLGRDPQCDLVLDSNTVSSRHGLLEVTGAGYQFTDLRSSNGSALVRGSDTPSAIAPGEPTPLKAGDILLLGAADAPVRIRVEAGTAPFAAAAPGQRTVLASAPLTDLLRLADDGLNGLSARAIAANTPEELAGALLDWLKRRFPAADGHSVQVTGAGFSARAGSTPPTGLARVAASRREVVVFEESGEALPMTASIAQAGVRAAVVAPLLTRDTWHGLLAVWTQQGAGALPQATLDALGVAASLVSLCAATLGIRLEGETERARLEAENRTLRAGESADDQIVDPIGSSPSFLAAVELCRTVAPADVPVLLLGETGTGKEVLARALHRWSPRAGKRFVAFNCAAVPENLLESELFGHVRGAFTGAARDKPGLFEEADGGTVFLDEIGEMPAAMQAKMLRVLQDGEVRRVGATRSMHVDARVVSATHRDLRVHVEEGTFRADLMYRLNAVTIRIPALRERGDDIALLAHVLLGKQARRAKKRHPGFSPDALAALLSHPFPGNVRELQNEVLRSVALTPDGTPIPLAALSDGVARPVTGNVVVGPPIGQSPPPGPEPLKKSVERAECAAVEAALQRTGGNVSAAARELGLTRPGLYKVMERLGLRG
ncbi:MAG: transcriptional regulator with GAF, ATPase, and Fis domain [Myxococcota bacterium]|jgi:transcriptional regulator with GAF, ATPase, and Fis domain